jgi:dihydrolipoamide dehydrogenase
MRSFDVVVIGAGPAGEVAAGRLSKGGLEVALVESHLVGGECAYYACMPSKALLRPAEALAEVRRVPGAAEAVAGELDVPAALTRRDEVVHGLDDAAQMPWLEDHGIVLVRGRGRLAGERRVAVGEELLEARRAVVLATGSGALLPPIDGLQDARPWTNREATTARVPPESLVVIGGGVVGAELSQAWRSLGSQVTLVEGERHLFPREEIFACEQVTAALLDAGVDVRLGQKAVRVRREDGLARVELGDGTVASGHELLVALGRRPASADLGLDAFGLEPGRPVAADAHGRVEGLPWLYAIGDLNGRAFLTHMGKYQARLAADHLLGVDRALEHRADGPGAPRVIFTDPQVAAVGLTTRTAGEAGLDVGVVDVATDGNAGASFHGRDTGGQTRVLVDRDRGVLVGATFVGADVAELLHAATIAIAAEVPLGRLRHAVPAFPTRSEIWLAIVDELEALTRA